MRVIILAAGEGTRLRPLTNDIPKCMVQFAGAPLLVHQLRALRDAGLNDFTVITGYRADALPSAQIAEFNIKTIRNEKFGSTNMVASLMVASHLLDGTDDVLIAYSDIVYSSANITNLMASPANISLAVNSQWEKVWQARFVDPLSDAETLKLDEQGRIREIGKKPQSPADVEGQYMGLIKVAAPMAPRLVSHYQELDRSALYDGKTFESMFMTSFLQSIIEHVEPIEPVFCEGGWLEIDSLADLEAFQAHHDNGTLGKSYSIEL